MYALLQLKVEKSMKQPKEEEEEEEEDEEEETSEFTGWCPSTSCLVDPLGDDLQILISIIPLRLFNSTY